MAYQEDTEQLLESAGFVDISRKKIRVPFQNNGRDEYEWTMTTWYRGAMGHTEPDESKSDFVSLSMSHFTRQLGWSEAAVRDICRRVTWVLNKRTSPLYHNL